MTRADWHESSEWVRHEGRWHRTAPATFTAPRHVVIVQCGRTLPDPTWSDEDYWPVYNGSPLPEPRCSRCCGLEAGRMTPHTAHSRQTRTQEEPVSR